MSQWASQNHTIHPSEDCLRRYLETKNTSYFWDQTYSQLWQHKDKDKDVLSLQVHTSRVAVEKAGRSKRPHIREIQHHRNFINAAKNNSPSSTTSKSVKMVRIALFSLDVLEANTVPAEQLEASWDDETLESNSWSTSTHQGSSRRFDRGAAYLRLGKWHISFGLLSRSML